MGHIEEALREKFFPTLLRREDINATFRKILGHSVKLGGLGIPDPWMSADISRKKSKAASGELVDSVLGGSALNYVGNRECIRGGSAGARR